MNHRGELPPDSLLADDPAETLRLATHGCGVVDGYVHDGDSARAGEVFGYVVAEAGIARMAVR